MLDDVFETGLVLEYLGYLLADEANLRLEVPGGQVLVALELLTHEAQILPEIHFRQLLGRGRFLESPPVLGHHAPHRMPHHGEAVESIQIVKPLQHAIVVVRRRNLEVGPHRHVSRRIEVTRKANRPEICLYRRAASLGHVYEQDGLFRFSLAELIERHSAASLVAFPG